MLILIGVGVGNGRQGKPIAHAPMDDASGISRLSVP